MAAMPDDPFHLPKARPMEPHDETPRPEELGRPMTGRIMRLHQGAGQGYIRAYDGRQVFFHRGETDGVFADLRVGDVVTFDLIEDLGSGLRAQRVRQTGGTHR
jgi:cold shock CspA family protein